MLNVLFFVTKVRIDYTRNTYFIILSDKTDSQTPQQTT